MRLFSANAGLFCRFLRACVRSLVVHVHVVNLLNLPPAVFGINARQQHVRLWTRFVHGHEPRVYSTSTELAGRAVGKNSIVAILHLSAIFNPGHSVHSAVRWLSDHVAAFPMDADDFAQIGSGGSPNAPAMDSDGMEVVQLSISLEHGSFRPLLLQQLLHVGHDDDW